MKHAHDAQHKRRKKSGNSHPQKSQRSYNLGCLVTAVLAISLVLFLLFGLAQPPSPPVSVPPANHTIHTTPTINLRVVTEDFPPYNFKDSSGQVTGQSTAIVREILERLNQTTDGGISLLDFSRGYSLLLEGPNVLMYSVGRTPQREGNFKWVGPVGEWRLTLYAYAATTSTNNTTNNTNNPSNTNNITTPIKPTNPSNNTTNSFGPSSNPTAPTNPTTPTNPIITRFNSAKTDAEKMAIAKSVGKICVVKDDVRYQFLVAHNFTNIDAVPEDGTCAVKLAAGDVDLWFGSSTSFEKIVEGANISSGQSAQFVEAYPVETNGLYLAFSKDVPDQLVASWQAALDGMKADGTFDRICTQQAQQDFAEHEFRAFLRYYEAKVIPLEREDGTLSFAASISGKDEDYEKVKAADLALTLVYTNRTDFAKLKALKESGLVTDPMLRRELDILYYGFLSSQVDEKKLEELINLENAVALAFNTYRVQLYAATNNTNNPSNTNNITNPIKPTNNATTPPGSSSSPNFIAINLTDNEVDAILKDSTDSAQLEAVWLSSKQVGPVVSGKVIQLVKLRNEIAQELGYRNYYEMSLIMDEKDPALVQAIFDALDNQTSDDYAQLKDEIDTELSQRYGVPKSELMPWHYQDRFFQVVPASMYGVNFDAYYAGKDLVKITEGYYASMGLPIDDVLARSDLYEKPGKYQHAYTTSIDRMGDVRIVANVKPDAYWMDTMLHEAGHAAHMKYINQSLPWLLRSLDIADTEAIALMFQEMAYKPEWMERAVGISDAEASRMEVNSTRYMKAYKLVFSRWSQVMYHFEKSMYEDPDQDLNKLWWDLVEKYQLVKRPVGRPNAADWASKIHLTSSPAYYHNYLLGWLIGDQVKHYIQTDVLASGGNTSDPDSTESFYGRPEVGEYLKSHFFNYGIEYRWDKEVELATGEKLTAKYFAEAVAPSSAPGKK